MTKKVIKEPRARSYANWIKGIEAKDTKPTAVKKPTVRKRVKATTTTISTTVPARQLWYFSNLTMDAAEAR